MDRRSTDGAQARAPVRHRARPSTAPWQAPPQRNCQAPATAHQEKAIRDQNPVRNREANDLNNKGLDSEPSPRTPSMTPPAPPNRNQTSPPTQTTTSLRHAKSYAFDSLTPPHRADPPPKNNMHQQPDRTHPQKESPPAIAPPQTTQPRTDRHRLPDEQRQEHIHP